MEADSQPLSTEASRIEEDALYSSRGHFEAAARWSWVHKAVGIPTVGLAALVSAAALKNNLPLAAVLSGVVATLTAVMTFLSPAGRAAEHHLAGTRFNGVRNRARFLREIDLPAAQNSGSLTKTLRRLANKRDKLNETSPQIPRWAFERARKGIEAGETKYQIDLVLPAAPTKATN